MLLLFYTMKRADSRKKVANWFVVRRSKASFGEEKSGEQQHKMHQSLQFLLVEKNVFLKFLLHISIAFNILPESKS